MASCARTRRRLRPARIDCLASDRQRGWESGRNARGHNRRGACRRLQGGGHAVHRRPPRRRVGRADGGRPPAADALSLDEAGGGGRHAGGDLGRDHRQPRGVPLDPRTGRRQHGQWRGACAPRPRAADRHHRRLLAAHLRDRAAPAHRPAGRVHAARQVEHDHRCQDRAPAGSPCHARDDGSCRRGLCTSSCRRARPRARPASTWPSRRSCPTSSIRAPTGPISSLPWTCCAAPSGRS